VVPAQVAVGARGVQGIPGEVHREGGHQDPGQPAAGGPCERDLRERVIGTLRRDLLDRLLIVNEQHLRQVLTEYLVHYNTAWPHRSIGQLAPAQTDTRPPEPVDLAEHWVHRKEILGGLTNK
jgi:hypothetical protein